MRGLLAAAIAGIAAGGIAVIRDQDRRLRAAAREELSAVADLKAGMVSRWRRERLADAALIFYTPYAIRRAVNVLQHRQSTANRDMLAAWLTPLMAPEPYDRALLLDANHEVVMVHPPSAPTRVAEEVTRAATVAGRIRGVTITELHRREPGGSIGLGLVIPLVIRREGSDDSVPAAGARPDPEARVVGYLVLDVDAANQLFPMLAGWPTPTGSAESLLVRRDGDAALILSPGRTEPDAALRWRMPFEGVRTPAVLAVQGVESTVSATDYRGKPVQAALRRVPDSGWFLIAKKDDAEILAGGRVRTQVILALMVSAMFLVAGIAVVGEQRVRASSFQELYRVEAARRESEGRYRALFEAHPHPMWIHDLGSGRILTANRAAVETYGYTFEDYQRMTIGDLRAGEERGPGAAETESDPPGKAPDEPRLGRHRKKDGTLILVEVSSRTLQWEGRSACLVLALDVTARERAQSELEESEKRLALAVTESPLPVMLYAEDGAVLKVSRSWCDLTGYAPDELATIDAWTERAYGERRFEVRAAIARTFGLDGRRDEGDFEIRTRSGDLRIWQFGSAPIGRLPDGRRLTLSIAQDVTERRRTEAEVRRLLATAEESRRELLRVVEEQRAIELRLSEQAALLDAANDAIHVRHLEGHLRYWNRGAERLYGCPSAEVLGRPIESVLGFEAAAFEAARAAVLEHDQWSGELRITRPGGGTLDILSRWTLVRDDQRRPHGILTLDTDLTEKKQLEARFLRAQRLEGIGSLSSGVAHDLNNILAPLLMTAPLLRDSVTDPEAIMMVDTIERCAQRGADIIRQLLTFARGTPAARAPLPIRHLCREMHKIIRETFPRDIQSVVDLPEDLWTVVGDATQLHQVLMNLCVNARDAMPSGGTLRLSARNVLADEAFVAMALDARPGPYVAVRVSDTGAGIAREHQERIFDPFFTTKEPGKGTGLGLPTVLGIARGHGGFVRVDSAPGCGSVFEVYLPALPESGDVSKAPVPVDRTPQGHSELILVVDDEADLRNTLGRFLEKHGFRVVTAANGEEGLAVFGKERAAIRAVVTDLMMPDMGGPVMVRRLRELEPRLPVLGMTGLAERGQPSEAMTALLPVILVKPFPGGELLRRLAELLGQGGEGRGGPAAGPA